MPRRRVGDMTTSTVSCNTRVGGGLVLYCISIAASLLITQTYRQTDRQTYTHTHTHTHTYTTHSHAHSRTRAHARNNTAGLHRQLDGADQKETEETPTRAHQAYTKQEKPWALHGHSLAEVKCKIGSSFRCLSHIHTYNAPKSGWGCWCWGVVCLARVWRPLSGLLHSSCSSLSALRPLRRGLRPLRRRCECCECCKFVPRSSKAKATRP
ncbi:hypothetical protein F4859DRAFT_151662 [Xylaria cf. heliscus]|nr:hypothetical protein F4859DRAFT_151662 [Xylaria cf. heliscus]